MGIQTHDFAPDHYHRLVIDFQGHGRMHVVCTAPEGSACRMVCGKASEDGCPEVDMIPAPTEDDLDAEAEFPHIHDLYDMGECNRALWLNEDATEECVVGTVSLPTALLWDGTHFVARVGPTVGTRALR